MDEELDATGFDWRRGGAAAVGLIAALVLFALVVLVSMANEAREKALAAERHGYDVALVVRNVSSNMSKAEAALARFVLDEDERPEGSGAIYANDWKVAGYQIQQLAKLVRSDPDQVRRVQELRALYEEHGARLALAARATIARQGQAGIGYFFEAAKAGTGLRAEEKLNEIIASERESLRANIQQSKIFSAQAERLTDYLSWLGILVGIGAIFLGVVAFQALRQNVKARAWAETESERAEQLELAVRERTQALWEANQALKEEAAEREAAEAQLRQVQKMEAVGQLTGGIAHDFNNMLAVVVGGIDLALRRLNGPRREVSHHLNNAMEGATRAAALTRRLLAFARAEPLLPVAVAPAGLVEGMLDLVDRSIGERLTVRTHFPDTRWAVTVDTNPLENAVLNLAVNARDAMEGEGQMAISVEKVALLAGQVGGLEAGDYVRISVSDTGSGMAPHVLERVFEPFFTTKPVGKGTGLGLSQIFGFARESGGDVVIESTLGLGSTVSLYLPRSTQPVEAPAAALQALDEALAPAVGTSILVVEDDPRVSRSTVAALEELGYRPIACSGGREALELLEREQGAVELVITDIMMPEMTGPELVAAATARWPAIAILYVTGYVGEAGSEQLSGHEILRKPFTVAGLASAVAGALARRPSEWPPAAAAAAGGR